MNKKTTILAIIFLVISVSLFGCKSKLPDPSTVTFSNGKEMITPYMLLNYAYEYQDWNGQWISGDGVGGHQFEIADYEAEIPTLQVTNEFAIIIPDKYKYSDARLYNAAYQEVKSIDFSEFPQLDAGTYYIKLDIEKTGRTIGSQTESTAYVGLLKLLWHQND